MREIWDVAWHRFGIISSIVADTNARIITVAFYFTIFVPFGIISILFRDPLNMKQPTPRWLDREPVPTDLESAKLQG